VDRQTRARVLKAQVDARERHARLAQAVLSVLTGPVRAALNAAQDPELLERLTNHAKLGPAQAMQVFRNVGRLAAVMPAVVGMERLALGMNTEAVAIDSARQDDDWLADRIQQDPEATDLAIALLDRLTHPRALPGPPSSGQRSLAQLARLPG
jgi:hypothetical protein